ncbi:MAG: hypothetical protein ACTTH0_00430 [Eubacteriales bacterium]
MLKEFIDFVDSILPSVSSESKQSVQEAILQFKKEGRQLKYLTDFLLTELSQGDMLSAVPFQYFEKDGKQKTFKADALVLSTSCHIDNKDKLVLVPIFPLDSFKGNLPDLKENKVIDYMYIPDSDLLNSYVNFEIMNTFSKELIVSGIEKGLIKRRHSLSQIGYYFFIIKLTVYLMRREDLETLEERNK